MPSASSGNLPISVAMDVNGTNNAQDGQLGSKTDRNESSEGGENSASAAAAATTGDDAALQEAEWIHPEATCAPVPFGRPEWAVQRPLFFRLCPVPTLLSSRVATRILNSIFGR